MDELITQVGVGGIFAILVIRMVLEHVKTKNGKENGISAPAIVQRMNDILGKLAELTVVTQFMADQVKDLYKWHDSDTNSQEFVSRFNRLSAAIERTEQVQNEQVALLQRLTKRVAELSSE